GSSWLKQLLWYFLNAWVLNAYWFPWSGGRVALLRLFGARIGQGVNIKPHVNIKYPWLLTIGDHSWIGENVWIDNLVPVTIGNHCCLSQGALLLTGNHDYHKTTFDLMTGSIVLEDGVWIGAQAVVTPGVTCHSHAVLAVGSVASTPLDAYTVYRGNPAVEVRQRIIQ
ncbi:MAG: WcaF family extracellular polysaccharide biosynthesis acetyltransferase, partial [Cyclobacteriaceae bacterium]|nr:WcaF family extracellular polysaccharide biosynthesis acetyltransferase [Cyclobacteriaceae bacterium]